MDEYQGVVGDATVPDVDNVERVVWFNDVALTSLECVTRDVTVELAFTLRLGNDKLAVAVSSNVHIHT